MSTVVAIACNLIVVLIILSGIFSTLRSGIRVSGLRLLFTILGGVGAYFLTPAISTPILNLSFEITREEITQTIALSEFISHAGISLGAINSIIYLIVFMAFYLIGTICCNIVKHILIKRVKSNSANKARIKRAKSINPKAERVARKVEFKKMKSEYRASLKWWRKLISCILGFVSAVIVGFVVLVPYGFISKDLNKDGTKDYLEIGYKYTLNGVIQDNIDFDFDGWLVHAKEDKKDAVCDHEYGEDNKCINCGEDKPSESPIESEEISE